jgi:hypothetical protein
MRLAGSDLGLNAYSLGAVDALGRPITLGRLHESIALMHRAHQAFKATAPIPACSPTGRVRMPARPRERRERRHVARSTSSADGGSDPEPPSRPAATLAVVA